MITPPGRAEHLDTAPQFCGLMMKHDHERFSRQVPLQTNCAALKAVESLAADFVECLNRTAEIGAAVGAVS